jgi:DNA-binding response OmpR family regulator
MSSPATIPVVLLATADEDYRFAITTALRHFAPDAVLMEVRDGDQFLNWLQLASDCHDRATFPVPDLVLLDLDLHGKDALCVLRWLRRDETFVHSHVVVLTPASRLWRINEAYRAGADSFLAAPFDIDDFRATYEMVRHEIASRPDSADRPPMTGFCIL